MAVYRCKVLTGKPWQVPLRVLRLLAMAGLLWWAWREVRPIEQIHLLLWDASRALGEHWELGGRAADGLVTLLGELLDFQPIAWLTDALPYILAGALVLCAAFERLAIEDNGIRLYFGFRPITLFFVRWDRLRSIRILQHGRHLPTVILHYTNWMHLPSSVGIHARRYAEGSSVTDTVVTRTVKQGVPGQFLHSPDWVVWAGRALMAGAIACVLLLFWLMYRSAMFYNDPTTVTPTLQSFPNPLVLGLLFAGTLACAGLGFGLLSAYHRGGIRRGLLLLWLVLASEALTWHLNIYWLIYFALYGIHSALLHPVGPPPFEPIASVPHWHWDAAFTILFLTPAFAGLPYMLGVWLGVRRV